MRLYEIIQETTIQLSPRSEKAKAWIQKVNDLYPQTWQNNHVMPLGGEGDEQQFAMFELVPSISKRDAVEIKWFQAYPLRQGVGSKAMKVLQALAQQDGIALTLYPWDKGQVSQSKLTKFYRSVGFKPTTKGAKNMAWEVTEAFDQPYPLTWEQSEHGDVDALARLSDGSNLSIMFNQDYGDNGEEVTTVEFHRNNSQEVTGEGDAQRIFATVLTAIQQFIKEHKPNSISFSASKEVDPDQNSESRAKLYDRLVQRYARSMGYRAFRADTGSIVHYELSRKNQLTKESVQEDYRDAARFAAKAHVGQKRSGGKPYISHPVRVANLVKKYKDSEKLDQLLSAAFLHDTIEDTDTTEEQLRKLFGDLVASLVHELTSDKDKIEKLGKTEYLTQKMINMSSWGLVIKLADRLDNVTDIKTAKSDAWRQRYKLETENILDQLEQNRRLSNTHMRLISAIREKLSEINSEGVAENFDDGKNPGRKGLSQRMGIPKNATIAQLEKHAKAPGEEGRMARWQLNMRRGRNK